MPINYTTNQWALLGLVASDASYQSLPPIGQTLQEYLDSNPNKDFLPASTLDGAGIAYIAPSGNNGISIPGWAVVNSFQNTATGFGAVIYQSADKSKAIVAFTGTNGFNGQDWWTNLNLGATQWGGQNGSGEQVLIYIRDILKNADGTAFSGELLFTGQSLGGALAEYAAYGYAAMVGGSLPSRVRLITFNGLGSVDAIPAIFGSAYDPTRIGAAQVAHFFINNDIVSRLGGGHFQDPNAPATYALRTDIAYGGREYTDADGNRFTTAAGTKAESIIDAHRIESGFYRHFKMYGDDFRAAKAEAIVPLNTATFQSLGAAFAGFLSDHQRYGEAESWFRIASASAAMLALIPPNQLNEFDQVTDQFTKHLLAATEGPDQPFITLLGNRLKAAARDPGDRAKALTFAVSGWLSATLISKLPSVFSYLTGIGASGNAPPGGLQVPVLLDLSRGVSSAVVLAKSLVGLSALTGDVNGTDPLKMPQLAPDQIATALSASNWEAELLSYATQQAEAQGKESGTVLADFGKEILNSAEPIAAAYDPQANVELVNNVIDAIKGAAKGLANAYSELTLKNLSPLFTLSSEISRIKLDEIVDGVLSVIKGIGQSAAHLPDINQFNQYTVSGKFDQSIVTAAQLLEDAGQAIVIRPGLGTNPFDDETYSDENNVAVSNLREGGVSTFTLYLPYDAGAGGQRIKLKLSGPAVDKFQVLRDADPLAVAADGTFELIVPEGARQIVFGLRAAQDLDADETLSLDAQLVDASDAPTHQAHTEVTINFDALAEVAPAVTTTIAGTAQDDNRLGDASHRPVLGAAGSERVQGLAGRDEVSGKAGDDIVEGGTGVDVVAGNDGNDAVFADNALTETNLRNYVTTSATAVTAGAMPAQLQVTSSEWLQGGLGDDTVVGADGNDILFGGGGKDLLVGGAGHDVINGDDDYEPGNITNVYVQPGVGPGAPFDAYYRRFCVGKRRVDGRRNDTGRGQCDARFP